MELAAGLLVALLVSLGATIAAKGVARRLGLVMPPREDRWHREPVPLLGGVAIILGILATLVFLRRGAVRFGPFLLVALAMGAVGLIDDVRPLRPQDRKSVV